MPSTTLKRVRKVLFFSGLLVFLKTFVNWPLLWDTVSSKAFQVKSRQQFMKIKRNNMTSGKRTKVLNNIVYKRDSQIEVSKEATTRSKRRGKALMGGIYGSKCPPNPHKTALQYLLHRWIALDYYYNLSSFLCGGSLIGSLRDGDLIPYDRDIDVCLTMENYKKVRLIRSGKPFNYHSAQIALAVQEDYENNNVSNRTLVDCRGRITNRARDPCSFQAPGARLISREVYIDIFVIREHGKFLRDHEYEKTFLKRDIFPLKPCRFMGVTVKCPYNEMALLLQYYEPDVLTNPHYKCLNNTWVATCSDAEQQFKIWFNKRLQRLVHRL